MLVGHFRRNVYSNWPIFKSGHLLLLSNNFSILSLLCVWEYLMESSITFLYYLCYTIHHMYWNIQIRLFHDILKPFYNMASSFISLVSLLPLFYPSPPRHKKFGHSSISLNFGKVSVSSFPSGLHTGCSLYMEQFVFCLNCFQFRYLAVISSGKPPLSLQV